MDNGTHLNSIKQIFQASLPQQDGRAKLQAFEFVTALIFCFVADSKIFSLEAIRRKMIDLLKTKIPKSSFWDRLSTQVLSKHLQNLIGHFMGTVEIPVLRGRPLLEALGVKSIKLIDSTSISLWDKLKTTFPGTRTTAGVKWHACFDLLSGMLDWFDLSSTSSHDRKYFPLFDALKDTLSIFDLGYFDYGLMNAIEEAQGFFYPE